MSDLTRNVLDTTGSSIAETSNKEQPTANKRNKSVELPWWVELLFVQIGLPDSWLRYFLKKRKKARKTIVNIQKPISFSILALAALIYVNPIIRHARLQNACITNSKVYIKKTISIRYQLNDNEVLAWSNRFCNGGSLN